MTRENALKLIAHDAAVLGTVFRELDTGEVQYQGVDNDWYRVADSVAALGERIFSEQQIDRALKRK